MPRIRKSCPPEILAALKAKHNDMVFTGSCKGFSIGDKVTAISVRSLIDRIGTVIGFTEDFYLVVYFKDSGFDGARGKDICTLRWNSFTLLAKVS